MSVFFNARIGRMTTTNSRPTIKRKRSATISDLCEALNNLTCLLKGQDEEEAIADLNAAADLLKKSKPESLEMKSAVKKIIDAFEGEHELIAYTLQREGDQWTEAEELSQSSSRVLSLARRLR